MIIVHQINVSILYTRIGSIGKYQIVLFYSFLHKYKILFQQLKSRIF